jgi:chromosome segregation ATPase
MTNPFHLTAASIAKLDVEALRAPILEHEAEVARLEAAINDARQQNRNIARTIRDLDDAGGIDGNAVAEALLEGASIEDAAAETSRLRAQREALRAGLAGLEARLRTARNALADARNEARAPIAAAADLAADALERELEHLAARLFEIFASAEAGAIVAKAPKLRALAHRLRGPLDRLAFSRFILRQSTAMPDEVDVLVGAVGEVLAVDGWRAPEIIRFPVDGGYLPRSEPLVLAPAA